MVEIVRRRNAGEFNSLPFDQRGFMYCSLIGELDSLEGEFLDPSEPDYPSYGLSVIVMHLADQRLQAANLIEKFVNGNVWFLARWEVDTGARQEIVSAGSRWRIPVVFDTVGNKFSEIADQYREALCK